MNLVLKIFKKGADALEQTLINELRNRVDNLQSICRRLEEIEVEYYNKDEEESEGE